MKKNIRKKLFHIDKSFLKDIQLNNKYYTGIAFVNVNTKKINDPNRILLNYTNFYLKNNTFDFLEKDLSQQQLIDLLDNQINTDYELQLIYESSNIKFYLIKLLEDIEIKNYQKRSYIDFYRNNTENLYYNILNFKMNNHLNYKYFLNDSKTIYIRLGKIYKYLI